MNKNIKLKTLFIAIILLYAVAISRMFYLQIIKNDYYKELLLIKTDKTFMGKTAPRGRILDINGNVLVDNKSVRIIVYRKINNVSTEKEVEIASSIASIIEVDIGSEKEWKTYLLAIMKNSNSLLTAGELEKIERKELTNSDVTNIKLERIDISNMTDEEKKIAHIYFLMQKDYSYQDKELLRNISEEDYIKIISLNLSGIRGEMDWERVYPYGNVLITLFGKVSTTGIPLENKEYYLSKGYELTDRVGISYLEAEYETALKGEKAVYKINNDNSVTKIKDEVKGDDLKINIDIELQIAIEEILEKEMLKAKTKVNTKYYDHTYVIVSEVNTGNIIAMSGMQILTNNKEYYFNDITTNIFTSAYTMGSIVKGATITVGYQNNLINTNKKIKDSCIKIYSNPIKCSWKSLGYIDDILALKYSSNYYQFKIAIDINGRDYKYNKTLETDERAFNIYRKTLGEYGLGTLTNIDIPNETTGIKGSKVSADLLLNMAIGQYDTYTPLQIVQYINTIATSGNRYALNIASREESLLNKVNLSSEYFVRIQEGFKEVFSKGGTASGYVSEEIKAAGKTGTSESFLDSDNDGVIDKNTISITLALYFPYDNPKYSLTIISPHISYNQGDNSYKYLINKHLSREITNKMFALYYSL